MGSAPVSYLNTCAILLAAYVAVFLRPTSASCATGSASNRILLPVLMVYCGLSTGWLTLTSHGGAGWLVV